MASILPGSAMAISLSILRFRPIPAFLQPFINSLYLMFRCRQAALRRTIHMPRKSLLRLRRSTRALTAALTTASLARRYCRFGAPRCPFTALRILFLDRRLAAPFLTRGISAFLSDWHFNNLFLLAAADRSREASYAYLLYVTYLPNSFLIVLATAPCTIAVPPILLLRLALLPLMR